MLRWVVAGLSTLRCVSSTTLHEYAVVPRRARIQGSQTCVSLQTRLESDEEEEEEGHGHVEVGGGGVVDVALRQLYPQRLQGYLALKKHPTPLRSP